jgi:hypothetical protein
VINEGRSAISMPLAVRRPAITTFAHSATKLGHLGTDTARDVEAG